MGRGIFVTGTDTDAGKSVVSAVILYILRKSGINACYFKPALSGAIKEGEDLIPGDGRFVCEFVGIKEAYSDIIPHMYINAVSPHLAGRIEGNPVSRETILRKYSELKKRYEYIVVEGAGGVIVPFNDEGYMTEDLIKDLGLDVFLAARAGVGTINHTSLSLDYLKRKNIICRGVIINGYKKGNMAHEDNVHMIKAINDSEIFMKVPFVEGLNVQKCIFGELKNICDKLIDEVDMEVFK